VDAEAHGVGVSKGIEDDQRSPALWAATPEMSIRRLKGGLPAGLRRVKHGKP
jgi:hypothetical protein